MAKMEKVNIQEWMVNPNRTDPKCSFCFYHTDCDKCKELTMLNVSTTMTYSSTIWVYVMMKNIMLKGIMEELDEEFMEVFIEDTDIVDEVDTLLEGEDNGKEEIDQEGNREEVREQPVDDENEADERGKRTRKRKAKKDMAKHDKKKKKRKKKGE
jgi:biopolymer transport protein ExbB/TolQ